MILNFQVVGVAIPKGSTKAFGYYAKNKQTGALLLNTHGKPSYSRRSRTRIRRRMAGSSSSRNNRKPAHAGPTAGVTCGG
jgi:hypothetical protein